MYAINNERGEKKPTKVPLGKTNKTCWMGRQKRDTNAPKLNLAPTLHCEVTDPMLPHILKGAWGQYFLPTTKIINSRQKTILPEPATHCQ